RRARRPCRPPGSRVRPSPSLEAGLVGPLGGLLRDQPERLRAPRRADRQASFDLWLLRRSYAPQPGPPLRRDGLCPLRRGGEPEGLPRQLGGVPGLRGWDLAGPPPALVPGSPHLVREVPGSLLGAVPLLCLRQARGPLLFDQAQDQRLTELFGHRLSQVASLRQVLTNRS